MSKRNVVKHYARRRNEDTAAIKRQYESARGNDYDAAVRLREPLLGGSLLYSKHPLPSLRLARTCLMGIRNNNRYFGIDTPARAQTRPPVQELSSFMKEYVLPLVQIPVEEAAPVPLRASWVSAEDCSDAEPTFAAVLDQIRTGSGDHANLAVYFDQTSTKPLILRKQRYEQTGLTLAPLEVGGVIVPPGTIVAMPDLISQQEGLSEGYSLEGRMVAGRSVISAVALSEGAGISPLRFSAWVYDEPLDRTLFAVSASAVGDGGYMIEEYSSRRANMLEQTSLDDFRQTAACILEMTGVTT